jgi:predicted  nucleic acid-binding Zn-ribbon protein
VNTQLKPLLLIILVISLIPSPLITTVIAESVSVIVEPSEILVPGSVYITVTGLDPGQQVYIYLDGNLLTRWMADESGGFTIRLNIPIVEPGLHEILIVAVGPNGIGIGEILASATINVIGVLYDIVSRLDTILAKLDLLNGTIVEIKGNTVTILSEIGVIKTNLSSIKELIENSRNAILTEIRNGVALILLDTGIIKANLTAINATITDIKDNSVKLETAIGEISANINCVKSYLENMNVTLVDLIVNSKSEVLAKLKTGESAILAKLDALNATIIETRDNVAIIQTEIGLIKADLATIRDLITSSHNSIIAEIENGVATISTELGVIKANLTAINATVVAIRDNIATINTLIGNLTADLTALNPLITSIGDNLVIIKTELGDIRGKLLSIEENTAIISTDLGVIKISLNNTLISELSRITSLIENARGEIGALRENVAELGVSVVEIKRDVESAVKHAPIILIGAWLAAVFSLTTTVLSARGIRGVSLRGLLMIPRRIGAILKRH